MRATGKMTKLNFKYWTLQKKKRILVSGGLELSVDPFPLCYFIGEWINIYLEHFGGKSFSAIALYS
jgi:hypothetical protein